MNKIKKEEIEQLLKDLAANVGYDIIPAPFNTPFAEESFTDLPESKQFLWTVPTSVLNNEEHKPFRRMCVEADIIDTVCTTSFSWPSNKKVQVAIILVDLTRRRRGCIKFVDACKWDIADETGMAAICNMLIHDLFPGETLLAFEMNELAMDIDLDDRWDDQVRLIASHKVGESLLPQDHMPKHVAKPGFKYVRLDDIFQIEDLTDAEFFPSLGKYLPNDIDIMGYSVHDKIMELYRPAIVVSAYGNLRPQKVVPNETPVKIDMREKNVLIHSNYRNIDLDYFVEQLGKESTLRQLPFSVSRLTDEELIGVLIEVPENEKKEA